MSTGPSQLPPRESRAQVGQEWGMLVVDDTTSVELLLPEEFTLPSARDWELFLDMYHKRMVRINC